MRTFKPRRLLRRKLMTACYLRTHLTSPEECADAQTRLNALLTCTPGNAHIHLFNVRPVRVGSGHGGIEAFSAAKEPSK